ncbi:MAG TPA: sigma-70 family RNA polymerase sigma factor [Cyclobacteriaceae bacterium]|nr:sigma-70 family RNA polymerase sigma factor [Cyclobacteriaceae bacterium]
MTQAQTISTYQPLLHSIAYNLVKCKADAEDIVQETFLRWLTIDHQKIANTKAYLIKAVTNNCLSHLEALKRKKEECIESISSSEFVQKLKEVNFNHLDLEVDLKYAFKVMQEKLQPLERAVFLLKEVFDFDYEALQKTLDKKKDHCRQLLSRARKKLEEGTSKVHDLPSPSHLLDSFKKACTMENASDLVAQLKDDIAEAIRKKF